VSNLFRRETLLAIAISPAKTAHELRTDGCYFSRNGQEPRLPATNEMSTADLSLQKTAKTAKDHMHHAFALSGD
jgi:hypothetical protein